MHTSILPTGHAPKSLRKPAKVAFARALRLIRMNPETSFAGYRLNSPSNTITA